MCKITVTANRHLDKIIIAYKLYLEQQKFPAQNIFGINMEKAIRFLLVLYNAY